MLRNGDIVKYNGYAWKPEDLNIGIVLTSNKSWITVFWSGLDSIVEHKAQFLRKIKEQNEKIIRV